MISRTAQKRLCQRQRKKTGLPKDPTDLDQIESSFTKTFDGRNFLLSNSDRDGQRIMIFATVEDLTRLCQSEVVILDGTFASCPAPFRQIFTIHGSIGKGMGRTFAAFVHILLPDKTETAYTRALKIVRKKCRDINCHLEPSVVLTDFEKAEMNAVRSVFPDSSLYGCSFHLAKNWYARINKVGLSGKYKKSTKVQLAFRKTQALAFLDPDEVPAGFNAVKDSAPTYMAPFFDYVAKNYVLGKPKKSDPTQMSRPRYQPEEWSMKQNILKDIPRTSNDLEGYHNKMNGQLKGNHLKFYAVLNFFKQEEVITASEYMRYLQGDTAIDRRTKKQKKKEEKLKNRVLDRDPDLKLEDYLLGIALVLNKK